MLLRCRPLAFVALLPLAVLALPAPYAHAEGAQRAALRDSVDRWTTPPPGSEAREPVRLSRRPGRRGWGFEYRMAALRQFEADIDGGGRLEVGRIFTEANVSYSPQPGRPLTVSFGYRFDGYDFDGEARGVFPGRPWSDVHQLSVGVPLFVPAGKRWFVLAIPVIRSNFEDGASWEDGITGGGLVMASYKVNERLRIGPGFGVFTGLEEDPTFFPVLLVDWELARGVRLKTGRGLGATQGPGLFLEWEPNRRWLLSLGGRYDKLRFRLDDHGVAPGGIGEESAFAAVLAARMQVSERFAFSMNLGATFFGEVRLEDRDGRRLVREDYDTALFAGCAFTLKL